MHVIPPAGQQVAVDSGPTLHSSNIVPSQLPQKDHSGTVAPGSNPGDVSAYYVDEDIASDTRPILLFDLNGTLTSLTATKYTTGKSLIRPGIEHLRRLQVCFVRTSSTLLWLHLNRFLKYLCSTGCFQAWHL